MSTMFHRVFVLLLFLGGVSTQTAPSAPSQQADDYPKVTPSMAVIIVILIAALFFMGFFSIYIRHCTESSSNDSRLPGGTIYLGRGSRRAAARGLEPSVVETFPTMQYSEVKEHKIGKGGSECAVCLNEFEDDETLRLIPKCDHVFHLDCIDPWLASHVTCPVCRANLVPINGEEPTVVVQTTADVEVEAPNPDPETVVVPTLGGSRARSSRSGRQPLRWFPKSHSTGHSLIPPGDNTERFTLRLPEEVRRRIMNRQLERSVSLVALPRERSSRQGYRADGSNRGKPPRPAARSERLNITRNPSFLSRASSFLTRASSRSQKAGSNRGDGSSTKPDSSEPDRVPV